MLSQYSGQGQHLETNPARMFVSVEQNRDAPQTCRRRTKSYSQNFLLTSSFFTASSFSDQIKSWLSWENRQTRHCFLGVKDLSKRKCQAFIREENNAGMKTGQLSYPEVSEDARQKGQYVMWHSFHSYFVSFTFSVLCYKRAQHWKIPLVTLNPTHTSSLWLSRCPSDSDMKH